MWSQSLVSLRFKDDAVQAQATIPFGWDGGAVLRNILVKSTILIGIGLTVSAANQSRPVPLILGPEDGEHLVRRPPPASLSTHASPFIIKVDRQNGHAQDFVMFTDTIPPGQTISPHRHPYSEEILFIQSGSGRAWLNGKEARVVAGSTIFMPRNTGVKLTNDGTVPIALIATFSRPGFDGYLRDISVPEGQVAKPLTVEEMEAIRARHRHDVIYDMPRQPVRGQQQ